MSFEARPESPWLGLSSFTQGASTYFFGRETELNDLRERVVHKPLTVLFGQSGWGKTSLLQAGLLPRLSADELLPVFVRLVHEDDAEPLVNQVLKALVKALTESGHDQIAHVVARVAEQPTPPGLWLLFHDPVYGLAGSGIAAPCPIFIFDQFEEIFTLGDKPARRDQSASFREALASLVENRPTTAVGQQIEGDTDLADRIEYQSRNYRVLLALRYDFLHLLERWRKVMPSVMENRMELLLLGGKQALEATVRPGQMRPGRPPIISEQVGAAIVRFVAGVEPEVPLAEIDAVPPLLSLVCAELNSQRLSLGDEQISQSQFEGSSTRILDSFYERSFEAATYGAKLESVPNAANTLGTLRKLVEDRLLSADGFRESVAFDTMLWELTHETDSDSARAILNLLIERRLLSVEERGGVQRVELTHDVLTRIARTSRDARQEKEAVEQARLVQEQAQAETRKAISQRNRLRRWVALASVLAVVSIGTALFAWGALRESQRERNRAEKALGSTFQSLKALYQDHYSKAIGNIPLEQARFLQSALRSTMLKDLQGIHQERPDDRECILLLCRLHLDGIQAACDNGDWNDARREYNEPTRLFSLLRTPSLEEQEACADLLIWRANIAYALDAKDQAESLLQTTIKEANETSSKHPDSWKFAYIGLRLRNIELVKGAPPSTATPYLEVESKMADLLKPSGNDYQVALWRFIIACNAYADESRWKVMPVEELLRLTSLFQETFLRNSEFTDIQVEYAASMLTDLLTQTALRLAMRVTEPSEIEAQRQALRKLNDLLTELGRKMPGSSVMYARTREYLNLEQLCINVGISVRSQNELTLASENHKQIAAAVGVPESVRDLLTDGLSINAKAGLWPKEKERATGIINGAVRYLMGLGLAGTETVVTDGKVAAALDHVSDMPEGDPLAPVIQSILSHYVEEFVKTDPSRKRLHLEKFLSNTNRLTSRWRREEKNDQLISFWQECYGPIDLAALPNGEWSSLVAQGNGAICALVASGRIDEATQTHSQLRALTERILKERPWDWHLHGSAQDMHFAFADALENAGLSSLAPEPRRLGWQLVANRYGEDFDFRRFSKLPKFGEPPDENTSPESAFLASFAHGTGGRAEPKKIVVQCNLKGKNTSAEFFILPGKTGYQRLMDQFRWMREYKGIEAQVEFQESLRKIDAMARESNRDFYQLYDEVY